MKVDSTSCERHPMCTEIDCSLILPPGYLDDEHAEWRSWQCCASLGIKSQTNQRPRCKPGRLASGAKTPTLFPRSSPSLRPSRHSSHLTKHGSIMDTGHWRSDRSSNFRVNASCRLMHSVSSKFFREKGVLVSVGEAVQGTIWPETGF